MSDNVSKFDPNPRRTIRRRIAAFVLAVLFISRFTDGYGYGIFSAMAAKHPLEIHKVFLRVCFLP